MQQHSLLNDFECLAIAPGEFGHRDHVEVAFEMLGKYDFLEAATRYAKTIRQLAAAAGHPEKYNLTITLAFLSLIAERKRLNGEQSFDRFIEDNPDLLKRDVLAAWYGPNKLQSHAARTAFVLPNPAA